MSVVSARAPDLSRQPSVGVWRVAQSAAAISVGLYVFALTVRLWAVGLIHFPMTEGSAYYVAVARNLVSGRGLVVDSIWSYATPPLVLPRPAFELWQPIATLMAALPMSVLPPDFMTAQLGFALAGSLLAPLAWLVARDTSRRMDLPERRAWFVALGAGALVAVVGPFLFATAMPDSTLPFAVLIVSACLVMPRALAGSRVALIGVGVLLGLAYLTRLEAVWFGVGFVALLVGQKVGWRVAVARSAVVAGSAIAVELPWLLRQWMTFGTPFPGQVADNVFFTRNEQVFSYVDRPTFDAWLAQGFGVLIGKVATALWHDLVNVLIVPATPVAVVGLVTIGLVVTFRRAKWMNIGSGAVAALLVGGAITYLATSVLFPVATLWGTFEHAAGPVLVGLAVAAVLGSDAFVAWLVKRRNWQRQNAWMAPAALIALTVPLTLFQIRSASRQAAEEQAAIAAVASSVPSVLAAANVSPSTPIITDRPIWLADAVGRSTLALPDEPTSSVLALARRFGAEAVVVVEGRGRYPAELMNDTSGCFTPLRAGVFLVSVECRS
jgi:hypothetical protein